QTQTWQVREGDTLSGIADRFYGDPSQWAPILNANPSLGSWADLVPGQTLTIPPSSAGLAPVSRFSIELAWTLPGPTLGLVGQRGLGRGDPVGSRGSGRAALVGSEDCGSHRRFLRQVRIFSEVSLH
ncbi:MAG TPA: LysM domain-containing protein, partial [Nocardioides sp.]|nr:LysM domain-containing protein [Nocardioides sp.]